MRFLLCARDRSTGAASVVSASSYGSRAEAVGAISAVETPASLLGSDLFVVDLETATPVVLVTGAEPPRGALACGDEVSGAAVVPEDVPHAEDGPFVPAGEAGGVGPSTLASDRVTDDADRAEVWWLEVGSEADTGAAERAADAVDAPAGPPAPSAAEQPTVEAEPPVVDRAPTPEDDSMPGVAASPIAAPIDFEVWTCSDCIFINTCPKTVTHTPATCGSFQWKP
jgi:hypothetical protein